MNIPHKQLSVDINRKNQYTVDFIGHVNDKDVRYIDVTFNAGGTPITLEEGCTATVTYVSEGVLIDQAAECTVSGSTVVIGVDSEKVENLRSGILEVQPKVVDPNGRVLTMQIPILVRISPDIAEHGQVDDGSLGSYAEVVREIAVARKGYESIGERMDNIGNPTDEQVAEGVEEYFEEHPSALVAGNSIWQTTTAPTAPAAPENPGYGFAISNLIGGDRDVQIGDVVLYSYYYYNITSIIGSIAYAETRVSIRGAKGSTGAKGDPGDDYVLTAQDKVEIAGMVDISGKEDTIHKKSAISGQSQTGDDDTFYPTVGAVRNYTDGKVTELEGYVDDELDDMDTAKADKATTLAGYGITNAYTKAEVDNMLSADNVPSYVIEEAESVISKALSHTGLGRTVRFIAVSDAHNDATDASHDYTKTSNLHCGQAVKYIADRLGLDFAASLGDMTWAGVAHTTAQYNTDWLHADIRQMNRFISEGFKSVPNIRVVGNHDQCATTKNGTSSRLQNSGAYQYFGRYNAGKNINPGGYGYYDLENVKLRVIYLNTSDTVSTSSDGTLLSVSSAQKDWLCETLIDLNTKSDASSWKILLLSHAPLDMIAGVGKPDTEQNHILIPYTNGGSYGAYSFTNHSAKIIGNCHGHTHCYNVGYISDRIRRFTIPNSNFYDNNHYGDNPSYDGWNEATTYPKTANSRTDTSFSLVTIDLDNDVCYVDNYGAGYDRDFNVDYKKAVSSISNLSYTGTTTVGQNIDTSAISYTVNYSDGSTSSRTGSVTVSPATILQVGSNSVTVSYTENGVTVTGSLTITGTAPPVTRLLDLDRTEDTATAGDLIPFDTTKYYKNIANGTAKGYGSNCTVYSKSSDSISLKESGTGGITVGYPVELPSTSSSYTFTCDYSGTGSARIYYRIFNDSGTELSLSNTVIVNSSATTGSVNATISAPTGNYKWLIIMFSSNTGGSKEYTNVSLTVNN